MNNIYYDSQGEVVELTPEQEKEILSKQFQIILIKRTLKAVQELNLEQKGMILDAIILERLEDKPADIPDKLTRAIYKMIKEDFKQSDKRYIARTIERGY